MSEKPQKSNAGPEPVPLAASEAWSMMLELVLAHERRRRVTEELGMSFGLVRAIRRLARHPMSMGELADALGIERPNATVLVDDLESRGLARRRPHPSDRRAKIVEATAKGTRRGRQAEAILATPPAGAERARPRRPRDAPPDPHRGEQRRCCLTAARRGAWAKNREERSVGSLLERRDVVEFAQSETGLDVTVSLPGGGVAPNHVNRPLTPLERLLLSDLRLNATAAVLKHVSGELGKEETRQKLTEAGRHVEEAEAMLADVLDSMSESKPRSRGSR